MSNWPLPIGGHPSGDVAQDESNSEGVVISGGTTETVNEKRPWAELFSAAAHDLQGIFISVSAGSGNCVMDLGVGAAASEVVLVPDLFVPQGRRDDDAGMSCYLPVSIPAGTRVATRAQTTIGSNPAFITAQGVAAGPFQQGFTQFESIGTTLSSASRGTTVIAHSSANTEGAWTELKSATDLDLSSIMVSVGQESPTTFAANDDKVLLDLAIGAASSEIVIIEGLSFTADTFSDYFVPSWTSWMPCNIPAGSRVAARIQCSTGSLELQVALLGVG